MSSATHDVSTVLEVGGHVLVLWQQQEVLDATQSSNTLCVAKQLHGPLSGESEWSCTLKGFCTSRIRYKPFFLMRMVLPSVVGPSRIFPSAVLAVPSHECMHPT